MPGVDLAFQKRELEGRISGPNSPTHAKVARQNTQLDALITRQNKIDRITGGDKYNAAQGPQRKEPADEGRKLGYGVKPKTLGADAADRADERAAKAKARNEYDLRVGMGKHAYKSIDQRAQELKTHIPVDKTANAIVRNAVKLKDLSNKALKGVAGRGRGNWGHAGRPGERGGSA